MNDTLISATQGFTLDARHILEREASEQLEGIYGWMPDGSFGKADLYPAIKQIDAARETRRRLEAHAEEEKEAGFNYGAARQRLVRETAFTWLNRFVALRMMEERRLVKETVSRLTDSNAFKLWLADEIDPGALKLHDQGETPVNPIGEGPRNLAYRRFFLWQCGELSRDVSVLFDPETLPSRLFPRPNILKTLVANMNTGDLVEAWKQGNEETIGWIYQAFNAEELQAAFASAREQGKKFEAEDIPAVTQLFTIRWVVRFLVENTLGRLWIEMHPESRLKEQLAYLVPSEKKPKRAIKQIKRIKFLDPACGSMHFGLVAFDIFAEMYREELENAGKAGWPEKASVLTLEDIPTFIVKYNLHGIDLDLRAVQLSALTLFLRARSLNPKCAFSDRNLACCNIEQITGGRLDEFIKQARFSHPIYERILRAMSAKLKDSDNLGTLLRPERELERLIAEEREKAEKEKQFLFAFPGITKEQFQTQEGIEEFFEIVSDQILRHLDNFTRESRDKGADGGKHFAAEAAKGLRFLRLVQERYEVVTTNPPYLSGRKMNKKLAALMAEHYPIAKSDLYAAFILRCEELLDVSGLMGMLTMHSFMFISSYEDLRDKLRSEIAIETLAHFGGGLFTVGNPGTLQTAAFVLRRTPDERQRQENVGVYFRLVRERDAEAKRAAFESALAALRAGQPHLLYFHYHQGDFDAVPDKPWVYWFTESIRETFQKHASVTSISKPKHGMATADNGRFVRKWFEVGRGRIGLNCRDKISAEQSLKKWFPYMKGGPAIPWYGNQQHLVNYGSDGYELKAWTAPLYNNSGWSRSLVSVDSYFLKGITWSLISSKKFAVRLSPGGFIFDVGGMSCFPLEELISVFLATLNSKFAKYLLSALNPTINFQVHDIERLPVPSDRSEKISALVNECVELTKQDSRESEITYDFIQPVGSLEDLSARKAELAFKEAEIDREVSRFYGLTDEDMAAIDLELTGSSVSAEGEDADTEGNNPEEEEPIGGTLSTAGRGQSWISYAFGIVLGRFEVGVPGGLGCGNFPSEAVFALKKLTAADGILANDPGQPQDLAERVYQAMETMLGAVETRIRVNTALGEGDPLELLHGWFGRFTGSPGTSFWKYHFQLYRKRPVYWPLQSPDRHYTVWVFHERFTKDTLFYIRNDIVEPRLRLAEREIADLKARGEKDRRARKELDPLLEFADDLREFSRRLQEITDRGYTPHIDDGVLLNAAPLHGILPSWPETNKAWQELEAEEYDWAQQAMEYWPERVKEKCKTNKSFAIAHGLEEWYKEGEGDRETSRKRRKKR